jgi:1-acyl-sn-glycerol-3-phosphate acyltransferase
MQNLLNKIKELYYYSLLSVFAQWFSNIFFVNPYYHIFKKTTVEYMGKHPDPRVNYIFVSNHRSYEDPPLLGHSVRYPLAFIAKKELFNNPILNFFMTLTSTISIDRASAESQTFKAAKKALKSFGVFKAWGVGVFIEGTRSTDPEMLAKPNKGPIFLARLCKVPLVPIGITYKGDREIVVKIGEPYEIDYKGDLMDQAWDCLEKISKLCDYKMPMREGGINAG